MKPWYLVAGIAACAAAPASATTFGLSYDGGGSELIYRVGTFTYVEAGSGSFSVDPDATSVTLANLSAFTFTTNLTITYILGQGPTSQPDGMVTYGLADLFSLSATVDHGAVTSLSFLTKPKSTYYGSGTAPLFYDDNGSAGTSAQGTSTHGSLTVQSPVPEPTTWLTALGGFGLLGAAMRRSRERGLNVHTRT